MGLSFPRSGIYVITRDQDTGTVLMDQVEKVLRGGAAAVQYRAKAGGVSRADAARLLAICRAHSVPLIINDDIDLAGAIGADGVHLGMADRSLEEARALLGPEAIVGVSCYDSLSLAISAERGGASYVAFGRFFPSLTKPQAPGASLDTLRQARSALTIPIVAIGGITPDNGGRVLEAGAGILAVIEAVFGAADPGARVRDLIRLFVPEQGQSVYPKAMDCG